MINLIYIIVGAFCKTVLLSLTIFVFADYISDNPVVVWTTYICFLLWTFLPFVNYLINLFKKEVKKDG